MKLLIVESPGKTKKIQSFLGEGWRVEASIGHVRDLPVKELGVDQKTLEPSYVATERGAGVISRLSDLAKQAEEVFLATDPDREGEAIAWHLKETLHLARPKRVTFSEITEKAVKAAISQPREIDDALVRAQEARRVLDRLVGYPVSQALCRSLGGSKSAGRVQSPAVKIVVDRERAIQAFKATTHYGVEAVFEAVENVSPGWKAAWRTKEYLAEGADYILDKALADKVAAVKYYSVSSFEDTEAKSAPAAPFTTSALQQAASRKLKLTPKKTMELAQRLYEAGHITYMRTDSANISDEAIAEILEYCRAHDLPAGGPRTFKTKAGAQEAHEAIRATHIEAESAGETPDEQALYRLIRLQALASQMADAVYAVRKTTLDSEEPVTGKTAVLEATGRTLTAPGWKSLFTDPVLADEDDEPDEEASAGNPIPELRLGSRLLVQSAKVLTRQTKPPARFTDATLVKQLENAGIGRPATYAAILDNIIAQKGYLAVDKKRKLVPTDAGYAVVDNLNGTFSFMDLDFTRELEADLDEVAAGKLQYPDVVKKLNSRLNAELAAFNTANQHLCPECGKPLRHAVKAATKASKGYDFWGCTGYPDCTYSAADDNGKPGAKIEKKPAPEVSEFTCTCGKPLIHRVGTSKAGKPYDFYGCSGYPKCKKNYNTGADGKPVMEKA